MQPDLLAHATLRGEVAVAIRGCQGCRLRAKSAPVPFLGPSPSRLMIVGEAPYGNHVLGGEAANLLMRLFREAGLPPLSEYFYANTVSCCAHGPVEKFALSACRDHLKAQIALCDPEIVLTLGATALSSVEWCSEKLNVIHGRPFIAEGGPYRDRLIYPTMHPAVGLRDTRLLAELRADLSTLRGVITGTFPVADIQVRIGRKGKIAA